MSESLLNQTVFTVYDVLTNIIPGSIIVANLMLISNSTKTLQPDFSGLPDSFSLLLLIFLSFIIGVGIQWGSSRFEKWTFRVTHTGYPSKYLLDEGSKVFPEEFKKEFRKLATKAFSIPEDSYTQHIFNLCYSYVIQKGVSSRVTEFFNKYSFSRSMTLTLLVEPFLLLIWAMAGNPNMWLLLVLAVASLGLSLVFYKRLTMYSKDFAEEVFRSFYVDRVTAKKE